MIFDNAPSEFISLAELKLFGKKIVAPTPGLPLIPPSLETNNILPPVASTVEEATKINIEDITAEINNRNSTIAFKFDPS